MLEQGEPAGIRHRLSLVPPEHRLARSRRWASPEGHRAPGASAWVAMQGYGAEGGQPQMDTVSRRRSLPRASFYTGLG